MQVIFAICETIFIKNRRIGTCQTEMERTQLRNYKDNKIQHLDIDILKRLCYVLECNLTDLIKYIPPEETQTPQ